jgi:hypothetical protein
MANPGHLSIVKEGADRAWRQSNPSGNLDLFEADLRGADLRGADLRGADLAGTILREADLTGADLREADLRGADLRGAKLTGVGLTGADLRETDLTKATLGDTLFTRVDLSEVKGLSTLRHITPSTVGVDTLYKSRGRILEEFLRGCGVPEGLITYLPSLIGSQEAIQFYSCFISYSHKDEAFAQKLHARMREQHLRVWYAPEDMQGGKKIHEQIDQAIRIFDKLLLVLSSNSMGSEWVRTEMYKARQREVKEERRLLFPIRLVDFETILAWECFDADTGKDLAREIREYFIPDFSNWKRKADFEAGFERLLKDLRAGEKTDQR